MLYIKTLHTAIDPWGQRLDAHDTEADAFNQAQKRYEEQSFHDGEWRCTDKIELVAFLDDSNETEISRKPATVEFEAQRDFYAEHNTYQGAF